jgi:galactokinase
MDQFASVCGAVNRLLVLDCRSLSWDMIAIPENIAIVIADTSIRRKLTGGEYNLRRIQCEEAVTNLKKNLPGIHSLRDVCPNDFYKHSDALSPNVRKRARHVVEEIERTKNAVKFLEEGNIQAFGSQMNACHASLRDLYEVSCPELDIMVSIAQSLDGCVGARLTGAGFGGCTVNLVTSDLAEQFEKHLRKKYLDETGLTPEIYRCKASDGAGLIR